MARGQETLTSVGFSWEWGGSLTKLGELLTAEKLCKFWSEDFRGYRVARAAMIGYQAEVGIVCIIVFW